MAKPEEYYKLLKYLYSWIRIILEKLTFEQPFENFPVFLSAKDYD
jgi:hypothetical protein